jgi:hypothetical protein
MSDERSFTDQVDRRLFNLELHLAVLGIKGREMQEEIANGKEADAKKHLHEIGGVLESFLETAIEEGSKVGLALERMRKTGDEEVEDA